MINYLFIIIRLGTGKQMMHGIVSTDCFNSEIVNIIQEQLFKIITDLTYPSSLIMKPVVPDVL